MSAASQSHPRRFRFRWYTLFPVGVAALLPFVLWQLAHQPQAVRFDGTEWVADTGTYAGAESCRDCHREIVEAQLASRHALTIRSLAREPAKAPFGNGQSVADPLTGVRYTMEKKSGNHEIAAAGGKVRVAQRIDYEFGAGNHAYGYVAKLDDHTWLDARLNYYEQIHGWDFTSSQDKPEPHLLEQPLGRPVRGKEAARCFMCHSTVLRAHGVGEAPRDGSRLRLRPDRSELGITCEGCHGPMARHVKERRSGLAASTPSEPSADQVNEMCGRCHGLRDTDPAHPVIARFQPYGLSQSACFRASAGRLSCSTCHDPHGNARREPAFYEGRCLGCHNGAEGAVGKTVCPVNRKSGCVGCHMPADTKSMPYTRFVDHRIRVVHKPLKPEDR